MESQLRILQKKRTANFREDETKLLIQLWGSPLIQNKLFLTHRKAPVMRLLAANMQQRGFYRTPDEIKTRIRNLKCLYHRIKRTIASGAGVGTVDPDWPHYKAMDAILSKEYPRKDDREEKALEGPKIEDIKQEIEDIDIHDDMESWATNDSICSEAEDEPSPVPPLRPAPPPSKESTPALAPATTTFSIQPKTMPIITPTFTVPHTVNNQPMSVVQNAAVPRPPGAVPNMVPLLILNGLQPQNNQEKKDNAQNSNNQNNTEIGKILSQILEVQKENLTIEKQRLEVEQKTLEFNRLFGTQLLNLVPVVSTLLQHLTAKLETEEGRKNGPRTERMKRKSENAMDILKDSKILRATLENGIRRYMMEDDDASDEEGSDKEPCEGKNKKSVYKDSSYKEMSDREMSYKETSDKEMSDKETSDKESKGRESDNEGDSGIHNDENSSSSEK